MHQNGCVIVLTCQLKRQLAVANQRQLLSLRIVDGVELFQPFRLIAHFAWQIRNRDGLDVNCTVVLLGFEFLHSSSLS